jgi:long-chain acyl-CoA synthetase
MSNLWTLTKYTPNTAVQMAGETIPEVFWNAVAARGPKVWLRQKELGIWHS